MTAGMTDAKWGELEAFHRKRLHGFPRAKLTPRDVIKIRELVDTGWLAL